MIRIAKKLLIYNKLTHGLMFLSSNNKFYQMVSKMQQQQHFHKIPEQNIISKYLLSNKSPNQNIQQSQKNNQINDKNYKNQRDRTLGSQHFNKNSTNSLIDKRLKKVNYKQILANNSKGSIINQQYKHANLCLMGMNFRNTSYDSIYKSMMKFQPDCILVQNKPDQFNQKFQIIKKNPQTEVFSDKLYIGQLQFNKAVDLKMNFNDDDIRKLQSLIFPRKSASSTTSSSINKLNSSKQSNLLFQFLSKQIVCQKPLLSSIYYSLKNKNTALYLSQLPQSVYRQWICNTHTLMELQQLFKITAKSMPLYPGVNLTPYQLATYLFPDQFLSINDKYMATLIQIMLSLGYKKIMVLSGVGQNEAVYNILQNSLHCDNEGDIYPLINYLVAQKIKGNIIRDYDVLEIIEKHILLDTIYHGKDLKHVKVGDFKTTNKIIKHYAGNEPKQMMFKFRYQMCLKYSQLLEQYMEQGSKIRKKQFMRQAIRTQ